MTPVDIDITEEQERELGVTKVVFAKQQRPYHPLPALAHHDEHGTVTTVWRPSDEELAQLNAGGLVRLTAWTFNKDLKPDALQPVALDVVTE